MRTGRPGHLKTFDYLGPHRYSLTFCTLWQRYGFEHVLRDDELTLVVAKYIVENPVRAGLVKRVEDYPFLGSLAYSLSELLEAIAARSG